MRAAVLHGAGDVRLEQCPVPAPGLGEVLVRVEHALTCGTDVKVFNRGYHAKMIRPPSVFGHEFAGIIQRTGSQVEGFKAGDRVVAANSAPCDDCFYCRRGQPELCEDLLFLNGAYAQFVCVPARIVEKNLLTVPESLLLREAALVEPLACVCKGLEDVGLVSGETIVILGTGPIGLMFVALSKRRGARVICVGRREKRRSAAHRAGADAVIDAAAVQDYVPAVIEMTEEHKGADRVIEAVGRPEAWESAIEMVRPGGTVNLFGGCPADTRVSIDTTRMHYSEMTLKASFHHTPRHVREALDLLVEGALPTDQLITGEAPLEAVPALLGGDLQKDGHVKVAINPWW